MEHRLKFRYKILEQKLYCYQMEDSKQYNYDRYHLAEEDGNLLVLPFLHHIR
jgi:hypothetical protein